MPQIKNRKSTRLKNYDYSENGFYFVTICTKNREEFFGYIENGKMILNRFGEMAKNCWLEIPEHFPNCFLDEFVIMPNHIHGILIIENSAVGNKNFCSKNDEMAGNKNNEMIGNEMAGNEMIGNKNFCSLRIPWQTKLSRSASSIIRWFKIGVTKYFRNQNNNFFGWQKSFYDHIIRDEKSLNNIRQYVINNPLKWDLDKNNTKYCVR